MELSNEMWDYLIREYKMRTGKDFIDGEEKK